MRQPEGGLIMPTITLASNDNALNDDDALDLEGIVIKHHRIEPEPTPIRYATVCSGIEGASVAWEPLGDFEPVFFSEVAPFANAVLAHHWPTVPNLGDMTSISGADYRGKVDVLWGSTPCQSFSKAGLQQSLADPEGRGALTLKFVEVADEIDPQFIAWENVKHVIAANDNAFGEFLGALAGERSALEPPGGKWAHAGFVSGPVRTVAWRLFDAQHAGLAARRERIFVVATPNGGVDPRDILFERGNGARYPQPRREAQANPFTARPTSVDGPHFFNADPWPKWADNRAHTLRADTASGGFQGFAVRDKAGEIHAFETTSRMQERMLGFPPDHTLIPWHGKTSLAKARRKALGNSVAIPDVRWIGERIKASVAGTLTCHGWPDMPLRTAA